MITQMQSAATTAHRRAAFGRREQSGKGEIGIGGRGDDDDDDDDGDDDCITHQSTPKNSI